MPFEFICQLIVRVAFMALLTFAILPRLQVRSQQLVLYGLAMTVPRHTFQQMTIKKALGSFSTGLADASSTLAPGIPALRVSPALHDQLVQAMPVDLRTVPSMQGSGRN